MFDPKLYPPDAVLTTSEAASWTGLPKRTLQSLPNLAPLQLPVRERRYIASDVVAAVMGDARRVGAGRTLRSA